MLIELKIFVENLTCDYSNYFKGKVNVGIILTMNAPKAYFEQSYLGKAVSSRFGRSISFGREACKEGIATLTF
jgi:hypothetical protein